MISVDLNGSLHIEPIINEDNQTVMLNLLTSGVINEPTIEIERIIVSYLFADQYMIVKKYSECKPQDFLVSIKSFL